ncbi:uncharacterized protein MELLADRAFT_86083 [Melampsora larici-populina 98AG31]|uniref:Secreted protein n=1 Tax=Melampsora larici-populina (strain 98AG31 / pathotype 3-4-7) TaxID=747676 RepID=F4RKQ3_MELLP|nr:uncharacterized protein MELLADRAFT_86083 [Melampsora larici-populina 98AG31]EGG07136.1 hypothetical protein MELLADRAFT_86083 [Melampsora larici-populina 98AG31]
MPSRQFFQITTVLIFSIFRSTNAHSFILAIEGSNGQRSTGFGTRLTSRGTLVQNTGIIHTGDMASGQVGPCGRIFGGDGLPASAVDVQKEMAIAEADGISAAGEDGSVPMSMFAHNADGGGPYECGYSSDMSLKVFKPMNISLQIEGEGGKNPEAKEFAYPLTSVFPPDAECSGGTGQDTCIMRCKNPLGFGSCAAVKLFSKTGRATAPSPSNAMTPEIQKRSNRRSLTFAQDTLRL